MTTIHCLIIDDEPLARSLIRTFLSARNEYDIIGECTNPTEAYEILVNNDIDVIFLDIQMPLVSGVDFLRSLKHPPKIIFTTAFSNHAADAFTLNAVDYLVKPITEQRFEQALEKLKKNLEDNPVSHPSGLPENTAVDYIFFKIDGRLVKVQFDDVLYIEALKDFCRIFLKDGTNLLIGSHLKAVEDLLPPAFFLRVHRSFVVAIKAVSGISGNIVEIGKTKIPIGGNYKEQLYSSLHIR